jgi:manganese-transporting P-type ATPase
MNSLYVIGGCHTLAQVDKKLIGDPLEKSGFKAINWEIDTQSGLYQAIGGRIRIQTLKKFLFDSSLKRMSTISIIKEGKSSQTKILCKGAPEVLQGLLREVPEFYEKELNYYVKHGYRVISMAYKHIPEGIKPKDITREMAECDLIFAGFLIFQCPIKEDTVDAINKIRDANLKVKIITGDNIRTAAYVAVKLNLCESNEESKTEHTAFASVDYENKQLVWTDYEDQRITASDLQHFNVSAIEHMSKEFILCLGGKDLDALQTIMAPDALARLVLNIHVFARTSPLQKDLIIRMLNKLGLSTSMCGDGTNDVGSLKSATIGIAVLNGQQTKPAAVAPVSSAEDGKTAAAEPKVTSPWYWPTAQEMQTLTMEQIRK